MTDGESGLQSCFWVLDSEVQLVCDSADQLSGARIATSLARTARLVFVGARCVWHLTGGAVSELLPRARGARSGAREMGGGFGSLRHHALKESKGEILHIAVPATLYSFCNRCSC